MAYTLSTLACAAALALASTGQAAEPEAPTRSLSADTRFALVIGNSAYSGAPLPNARNDAEAIAQALERAHFKVDLEVDASQQQMQKAIDDFGAQLRPDSVGLFYFAGHGVQIQGHNYLVPVASRIQRESDVLAHAVDVQQLLDRMGKAHDGMNVVILDACRDNPFTNGKAGAGGLSELDAPTGSLIAFATAPGSVASDGKGKNGLYTQHLLANIDRPGTPIEEVFKRVRLGVRLDSNGAQIPWESTSLEGDFSFFPTGSHAMGSPILPAPAGVEIIGRAEVGYELLREGKLDDADREFRRLASSDHADVALMGREGMAEVMLTRGDAAGALKATGEILAESPGRSAATLIRARALAATGRPQDSAQALAQAAGPGTTADFWWQKSDALVAEGNAERRQDPKLAAASYEKALHEDPQSSTALSNLGVALNESGDPRRSMAVLEKAVAINPGDAVAAGLLRQVRDSMAERDDRARQQYIDDTVKELAARFRNPGTAAKAANADDWTSPALAITVLPFRDDTDPSAGARIGLDGLVQQALIRQLQQRGYTIVERQLLDKLMAEIKLGSSELADQDTQIRLGRVFAARLMVSGTLENDPGGLAASLRAIDTETTRLQLARAEHASEPFDPDRLASAIADDIAKTVKDKYPLKGRVVGMDGARVIINLGHKQGVALGSSFNVLSKGEPIELNGRVLGYKDSKIGQITVTDVQDQLSYGTVDQGGPALDKNLRIIARGE